LEECLERLARDLAAREGRDDEDRRSGPAAPDEEQAGEDHQRAEDNSASRVRDDLHHLHEYVGNRPLYPVRGADVEPVRVLPEKHGRGDDHEDGAGKGEHRRVQACRVSVRHLRTIPAMARLDAVVGREDLVPAVQLTSLFTERGREPVGLAVLLEGEAPALGADRVVEEPVERDRHGLGAHALR